MRNPGPTINGQRNPEGYITDYPVSASRETNNKIIIEIDELPVTAAVTLELEELSIDLSTHPSLEIGVRLEEKFSATKLIYRADSSSRDNHTETQTVTLTGDNAIVVSYLSNSPSNPKDYVRLKYKGE